MNETLPCGIQNETPGRNFLDWRSHLIGPAQVHAVVCQVSPTASGMPPAYLQCPKLTENTVPSPGRIQPWNQRAATQSRWQKLLQDRVQDLHLTALCQEGWSMVSVCSELSGTIPIYNISFKTQAMLLERGEKCCCWLPSTFEGNDQVLAQQFPLMSQSCFPLAPARHSSTAQGSGAPWTGMWFTGNIYKAHSRPSIPSPGL